MKGKYKHRFDRVYFINRWLHKNRHSRGDITIIGISRWFSGPHDYRYSLCFFGLEAHLWFKRTFIGPVTYKMDSNPDVIE